MNFKIILLLLTFYALPAEAAIKAVATTPDIAWLIQRIGGKNVEVKSLSKKTDNYHFLDARPDFILAVNRAELLCQIGAELEIGWLPKILEKAANNRVISGGPGDCNLTRAITLQEKPTGAVDRAMGDAHSSGNPHFWLSPLEMRSAAKEVENRLANINPEKAAEFAQNREALDKELAELHARIKIKLKPFAGKSVYQYHKDFTYFISAYGLNSLGSIEEIPGISPSAARLGKVGIEAKQKKAFFALASDHDPKSLLNKFEEISGIPVIVLPTSITDPSAIDAYANWQDAMAEAILKIKP